MSSLICTLLHFQVSSSLTYYSPALPRRGLGGDLHVCELSSVAAVDLEKCREFKTYVENPTVNNAGMCPWQNKRKSLQLDTSALCCWRSAKGALWIWQFADEAAIGLVREEWGNTVDGKRKMQEHQLSTRGWANFHCRFFFSISYLFCLFSVQICWLVAYPCPENWLLHPREIAGTKKTLTAIKVRKADVRLASPFQRN